MGLSLTIAHISAEVHQLKQNIFLSLYFLSCFLVCYICINSELEIIPNYNTGALTTADWKVNWCLVIFHNRCVALKDIQKFLACPIRSAPSLQRKSVVMDIKKVRCIWSIVPSPIIHRTLGQIRSMFCSVNVTNWDHLEYKLAKGARHPRANTLAANIGRGGLVRSPTTCFYTGFGDKINVSWEKMINIFSIP